MENITEYVQRKWRAGFLPGMDCILFGNGTVIMANTYSLTDTEAKKTTQHWHPLCDTTVYGIEKYEKDIWTSIDIFHGAISYEEGQIVFGDGAMGNEGFVASTDKSGALNWGIFFTFSNPIMKAEIQGNSLICTSEIETRISIQLDNLTKISVVEHDFNSENR